jgi:hypothetical protein
MVLPKCSDCQQMVDNAKLGPEWFYAQNPRPSTPYDKYALVTHCWETACATGSRRRRRSSRHLCLRHRRRRCTYGCARSLFILMGLPADLLLFALACSVVTRRGHCLPVRAGTAATPRPSLRSALTTRKLQSGALAKRYFFTVALVCRWSFCFCCLLMVVVVAVATARLVVYAAWPNTVVSEDQAASAGVSGKPTSERYFGAGALTCACGCRRRCCCCCCCCCGRRVAASIPVADTSLAGATTSLTSLRRTASACPPRVLRLTRESGADGGAAGAVAGGAGRVWWALLLLLLLASAGDGRQLRVRAWHTLPLCVYVFVFAMRARAFLFRTLWRIANENASAHTR